MSRRRRKKVNSPSESGGEFVFLCSFMCGREKSFGRTCERPCVRFNYFPTDALYAPAAPHQSELMPARTYLIINAVSNVAETFISFTSFFSPLLLLVHTPKQQKGAWICYQLRLYGQNVVVVTHFCVSSAACSAVPTRVPSCFIIFHRSSPMRPSSSPTQDRKRGKRRKYRNCLICFIWYLKCCLILLDLCIQSASRVNIKVFFLLFISHKVITSVDQLHFNVK